VANRRVWDEELPKELARAARSGQPLCMAILDLDHFKRYNDTHGDQGGDRLLKETAGVAAWDGQESADALVARADTALYAAKEGGRDRYVVA
jgi:PleD family two-component response regulator